MCYLRLKHSFVIEPGGRAFPLLSPLQSLNSPSSQDACATFLILVNYLSLFDNFEWQYLWKYLWVGISVKIPLGDNIRILCSTPPSRDNHQRDRAPRLVSLQLELLQMPYEQHQGRLIISHLKNLNQGGWTWMEPQHKTQCLFQLRDILPRWRGPSEEEVPDYDNDYSNYHKTGSKIH